MIAKIFKLNNPIVVETLEWIEIFFIAFVITMVLRTYIIEPTEVSGPSMEPTLQNGNRLIVNRFIYNFAAPKRGDVVVFEYDSEKNFIKRIVGIPGDIIDVKDGKVIRNGEILNEPYVKDEIKRYGDVEFPVTVTQGHYFVMGDNRNNSSDSRLKNVGENGLVPKSVLRGPVVFRMWPLNELGAVK